MKREKEDVARSSLLRCLAPACLEKKIQSWVLRALQKKNLSRKQDHQPGWKAFPRGHRLRPSSQSHGGFFLTCREGVLCRIHCRTKTEGNKTVPCGDRNGLRGKSPKNGEAQLALCVLKVTALKGEEGWPTSLYVYIKGFRLLIYCKVSDSEVRVHVDQVCELFFT